MRQETKSFISFGKAEKGIIFNDDGHGKYPLRYYNLIDGQGCLFDHQLSYMVFIYEGNATVVINGQKAILEEGSYFNASGNISITGEYKAVVIEILYDYKSYNMIGLPIENKGRLNYIDGCTDSILIHPIKKGDPCLNHLHFPKEITQTAHTHPSHRLGVVYNGSGMCVTPFGNLPLEKGCIFVIKEYNGSEMANGLDGNLYEAGTHKFDTYDSSMDVIAFHPDSDFGAEDEFHPMINRTIVNGVSANAIDAIKTK